MKNGTIDHTTFVGAVPNAEALNHNSHPGSFQAVPNGLDRTAMKAGPGTTRVVPVVLCGGSGTRLWPLSRKSFPKQFASLLGPDSLFERTLRRFDGEFFDPPMIITGEEFRFIVGAPLAKSGNLPNRIVIEPEGRNTAAPSLAAAILAYEADPEAVILIAPADHAIADVQSFTDAVERGCAALGDGRIVTFGISPSRAETGYGYLQVEEAMDEGMRPLVSFVEKPDADTAARMVADGRYLWNSGMFLTHAHTLIRSFERHAPQFIQPVREALALAEDDLNFTRLAAGPWKSLPDLSLDYAVMEHSDNLSVVKFEGGWNDLGGWDAVWSEMERTVDGNALFGPTTALDCVDTLLRSESDALHLVGVGLENIIAIAMEDAVLVADKSRAQDIKAAVLKLKQENVRQATQLPRDYRPWGWFDSLVVGSRFQVKRIVVNPGAQLSLQSHLHRSEHWVVVEGTARVTVDDTVKLVSENESVYIPLGAIHRMENPGTIPLVLIEVQTGAYLGEDDIRRYEDIYARA